MGKAKLRTTKILFKEVFQTSMRFILILIVAALSVLNCNAQDNKSDSTIVRLEFAGIHDTYIPIKNYMNDSLYFARSSMNSQMIIKSFHLTISCNGNIIKSIENANNNKFTTEMQDALETVHSNCTIIFGGIKVVSKYNKPFFEFQGLNLKLTVPEK